MAILYDWQCKNEHKFEALGKLEQKEIECPHCGENAQRLVSAPRCKLEGITGHFPDAAAKWEKMHTPKSRGGSMPDSDLVG